jgi:hypothetical protein
VARSSGRELSAAAGGCRRAALRWAPRDAAAAVRPWHGASSRPLPSPFQQVTRPGCAAGWHCRLPWPARCRPGRASVMLAWAGDRSPIRGCTTTSGDQVPPSDTLPQAPDLRIGLWASFQEAFKRLIFAGQDYGVQVGPRSRDGNIPRLSEDRAIARTRSTSYVLGDLCGAKWSLMHPSPLATRHESGRQNPAHELAPAMSGERRQAQSWHCRMSGTLLLRLPL